MIQVTVAGLKFIGDGLQRPECIHAERDGTLWVADARGGTLEIRRCRVADGLLARQVWLISLLGFFSFLLEAQRYRVNTVPLSSWLGAIIKDMAEMSTTFPT